MAEEGAQDGAISAVGILEMAEGMVARLEPATAATMADQVFGLLRKALDTRREARFGDPADVEAVERAAAAALVATTMKLKDTRFKPLFLGLLEWALRPPSGARLFLASQHHNR